MRRTSAWAVLALATGLSLNHLRGADPLQYSLIHGVFKPAKEEDTTSKGPIHPLPPLQRMEAFQDAHTFKVSTPETKEKMEFPIHAKAGSTDLADLAELNEEGTFMAPVDLTGSGVSDLIYTRKDMQGWKVLTNCARMPSPAQAFVAGYYGKGSDTRKAESIPADNRDLAVDVNLLAAVGDFLGNGTEQLAYTRPGKEQIWLVGDHGVTTMKANLKGIEASSGSTRNHWFFTYKPYRKGQRTRLAYYRLGADHLLRLVPKGMEFVQEQVPLKGNWEHLNQAVLDWPQADPSATTQTKGEDEKATTKQ